MSQDQELLVKNFQCDGTIPNYRIVGPSPSVVGGVRTTHAPGPYGVVQDRGGTTGDNCDVVMLGIGLVELAETIAAGTAVQQHTDNSGRAQVNTDINWRVGRLLRAGVAGDLVPIFICPT